MIVKVAAIAVAALGLLAVAAVASGPILAIIDVREGGPGGMRLVVPVPLPAARVALALAPAALGREDDRWIRLAPRVDRLLAELVRTPDGELVRILERSCSASVIKAGDQLVVDVTEGAERVHLTVPISFARDLMRRSSDGNLTSRDLAVALGRLPRGRLVDVEGGTERVSVRLW